MKYLRFTRCFFMLCFARWEYRKNDPFMFRIDPVTAYKVAKKIWIQ